MVILLALAVALLAYLVVDLRRSSALKRRLNDPDAYDRPQGPPHDLRKPGAQSRTDARHGMDAHASQARSVGNQVHGGGYL